MLISRLGLACEGEQISEGDLENYIRLFERPLSQEHLNAILAIFGWTPDALPLMAGEAQEAVLSFPPAVLWSVGLGHVCC